MRSPWLYLGAALIVAGFAVPSSGQRPVATASVASAPAKSSVTVTPAADTGKVADAFEARVETAVRELSEYVRRQSSPTALRTAVEAYLRFKDANPDEVRKPYLYYIDYGLNNSTPRGYVFNMETMTLVEGPFTVAHGRGSGPRNAVPTKFSNRPGSAATSLGLYVTQETYNFSGKSGGRHYTSIGLRMKGVSGRFNSNARSRGVVVHGAPYVTPSGAGRSEGCPAMEQSRARRLLPLLEGGAVVFQYSPHDQEWLRNDPWVNG